MAGAGRILTSPLHIKMGINRADETQKLKKKKFWNILSLDQEKINSF